MPNPGQSQYNLSPIPGQPGQPLDNELSSQDVVSAIALTVIPFGVVCELVSTGGKLFCQPLQDTGTAGSFLPDYGGISMLDVAAVEQSYIPYAVPASGAGSSNAGYPKGFAVPLMRRGRIFAQWDGLGATKLIGSCNVWHSSDGTHNQGVISFTATATTAGAEIDALSVAFQAFDTNGVGGTYTDSFGDTVSIVPIAVNLPGHT